MTAKRLVLALALAATSALHAASAARAATELRIAATVAPVHSLVSMVAEGIASADLIIRPGASPHDYALKPSEAQALNDADVVFWVGEALEPWMTKAVGTLAADAVVVKLGEVDGIERRPFRTSGIWVEDEGEHDDHGDVHDHDAHGHEGDIDPHLWLDPHNALIWLQTIAETLADADPAAADSYRSNAEAAAARIEALTAEIDDLLMPVKEKPYMVFHDAYQYFEHRFGLHPLGAVSLGDADRPGPARLIEIRTSITENYAVCVFAEPQFAPTLIETVIEGTAARMGMLDPIGAGQPPGAELYPALMRGLATDLRDCLG